MTKPTPPKRVAEWLTTHPGPRRGMPKYVAEWVVNHGMDGFVLPNPHEVTLKGIETLADGKTWMSMLEARNYVMGERMLAEDEAKRWILDAFGECRLRWRANQVVINGVVLSPEEAEQWLIRQGGEYYRDEAL